MEEDLAKEELLGVDTTAVDRFSFEGVETLARVCSIHDPDTVTVVFKMFEQYIKINVRLDNIDAPESTSRFKAEKAACSLGTIRLQELIQDKIVKVRLMSPDKYGRTLGVIYTLEPIVDDVCCVNDYLLEYQYVRQYSGGKKLLWTQEELNRVGSKREQN